MMASGEANWHLVDVREQHLETDERKDGGDTKFQKVKTADHISR